jgi:hypothetical protein
MNHNTKDVLFAVEQIITALQLQKKNWTFASMGEEYRNITIPIKDTEEAIVTYELMLALFENENFTYEKRDNGNGWIEGFIYFGGIQFHVNIFYFPYKELPELQTI